MVWFIFNSLSQKSKVYNSALFIFVNFFFCSWEELLSENLVWSWVLTCLPKGEKTQGKLSACKRYFSWELPGSCCFFGTAAASPCGNRGKRQERWRPKNRMLLIEHAVDLAFVVSTQEQTFRGSRCKMVWLVPTKLHFPLCKRDVLCKRGCPSRLLSFLFSALLKFRDCTYPCKNTFECSLIHTLGIIHVPLINTVTTGQKEIKYIWWCDSNHIFLFTSGAQSSTVELSFCLSLVFSKTVVRRGCIQQLEA